METFFSAKRDSEKKTKTPLIAEFKLIKKIIFLSIAITLK